MERMERVELCELARRFVDDATVIEEMRKDLQVQEVFLDQPRAKVLDCLRRHNARHIVVGVGGVFWLFEWAIREDGEHRLITQRVSVFTEPGHVVDPLPIARADHVPVSQLTSPEPEAPVNMCAPAPQARRAVEETAGTADRRE